jgi:hypothetical protein
MGKVRGTLTEPPFGVDAALLMGFSEADQIRSFCVLGAGLCPLGL